MTVKMEMHDFYDGNGPVPARRHINPNGSEGGWVAMTATVLPHVYIGKEAKVFGSACVYDDAQIHGRARVFGNAKIYDFAFVSDNASISGWSRVNGNSHICGNTRLHHVVLEVTDEGIKTFNISDKSPLNGE